jgi:hypothetical protein
MATFCFGVYKGNYSMQRIKELICPCPLASHIL